MRYARGMRLSAILAAVLISISSAHAQPFDFAQGTPATAEKDAVMMTVQAFFDTMTAADVDGARKVLQPQGRFHAMRMRDGKPVVAAFSNEEYFADLQAEKRQRRERIWTADVRIHGLIATVVTPYDFWIDGNLSHCGVDAFDLIKTEDGWKIAGGVYSVETQCEPSPLGPLKQ